ncbi:(2Fe-2S)-binding protein [Oceanicella sp. SM1341]|uniref:(2Fe-2S)-binding protein n=1 Tax=Oceanicella sp. SM1341 TaxID=1548889 RepID=UPI000E505424|nr:(2Fe-2S)-binding protein [Oceanicella sp. SM1341]
MTPDPEAAGTVRVQMAVNGRPVNAEIPACTNLADFLRGELGLTGTHLGCEHGVCGACTLMVDGAAVRGCLMLAVQADGAEVTTVEGLDDPLGRALREAFVARNALQCGFCTPGMLATLREAIGAGLVPERAAVRAALSGNFCRCTGYEAIVDAALDVIGGRDAR